MEAYYLTYDSLLRIVGEQQDCTTAGPTLTGGLAWVDVVQADLTLDTLSQPRAAQSPKGFFLPACESLGRYGPDAPQGTAVAAQPLVVLGVRACELRARNYLDQVLLEGSFVDPAYAARREAMIKPLPTTLMETFSKDS